MTECGNDVNQLETLFHDMMLCALCGEVFRDPIRLPKALPCTHTYCAVCLSGCLYENVVECPDCSSRYDIRGDVNTLPNSAMVMRVLNKVCKFCNTMAKLEECAHCKRISCGICHKAHLEDIREELVVLVQEISSSTEQLSSKLNLVDAALGDVNEKTRRVKAETMTETEALTELVAHRHERVMDQIEKEVTKERKRLSNIKKTLVDTQEINLSVCSSLAEELEQPVQVLAGRLNAMRNTCAVQLDKIKREYATVLSLDWDLVLEKPDHGCIRKRLEELSVSKPKAVKPAEPATAAKVSVSSPAMAHGADAQSAKNQSFSDHNASFIKINIPRKGRTNSKVFL